MKKKLFALALLTASASAFATPISTPTNVSDTPIIGGSNGSCGTVDLTNATSDYMLQPCETAVIRFNNQQYVPLHIAVPEPPSPNQPVMYEIAVSIYWASSTNHDMIFYFNNTSYPGQVRFLIYRHGDDINGIGGCYSSWNNKTLAYSSDSFWFDTMCGWTDNTPYLSTLKAVYYGKNYPKHITGEAFDNLSMALGTAVWNNTTTPWTSLGTFFDSNVSISGQIIVKRIS